MVKLSLLCILCTFSICIAYEQFLTFYSELNLQGDSLTFKSKQPDISNFTHFIINSKSYQGRGYWGLFQDIQYTGQRLDYTIGDTVVNGTYNLSYGGSIRHSGLLETSQQSISLYSLAYLQGVEKVITTPASNDITFTSSSIFSTGFSNWTFFTGSNFDGNATCYISTTENHVLYSLNSTLSNIQSVVRGCLDRIDTYLFAKDFDLLNTQSQDLLSNE